MLLFDACALPPEAALVLLSQAGPDEPWPEERAWLVAHRLWETGELFAALQLLQELEFNGIHDVQQALAAEHTRRLATAGRVVVAPTLQGWPDLPQALNLLSRVDQLEELRLPLCYRFDDTVWEVGPDSVQLLEARRLPEAAQSPHLIARTRMEWEMNEEASVLLAEAAFACFRAGAPEYALQLTRQALELNPNNAVAAQSLEALLARRVEEPSWARCCRIGSLLDTLPAKPIQRTPDARVSPLGDEPEGCDYLAWMGRGLKPERVVDYLAASPLLNREGRPNSALRNLLRRSDEEIQQIAHLATNDPERFFSNFWPALEGRHHLLEEARVRATPVEKPLPKLVWRGVTELLYTLTMAELHSFREFYTGEEPFYGFAFDVDPEMGDVRLSLNTEEQLAETKANHPPELDLRWEPYEWLFPTFESDDFRDAWEPYARAICQAKAGPKLLKTLRGLLGRVKLTFPNLPRTADFECRVCTNDA